MSKMFVTPLRLLLLTVAVFVFFGSSYGNARYGVAAFKTTDFGIFAYASDECYFVNHFQRLR